MNKKIFVYEKDPGTLQMLSFILTEEGYEVITTNTEFGIFKLIRNTEPDIILLDIVKPTVQGSSLCRAIRAADGSKHIPVIALSYYLHTDIIEQIYAESFITKPAHLHQLIDIIEGHYEVI